MWDGTAFYPLLVYTNSALIGTGWKDATGGTYNPPPTVSYGYGFNTVITNGVFTGNGSGLTNIPTSGVSGLGSAATNSASAFDTNNAGIAAALAATNAMGQSSGLAAFQNTNFFDLAGAGTAAALLATNNFGNTIAVNMTNQANTLTVKQLNLTNGWTVTAVTNTFSFSAKNNDDWAFYDYVTNGTLAFYNSGTHSLEYINCSQGFASNGVFLVTAAITNGLATTNYVQSIGTTSAVSMTNQANSFSGTATNFTLYGDANHTNWTYTDTTGWNNTNVAGGSVNIRNGNITASGTNTAGYYVGNGGGLINLQAGNIVGTLTNNAATATYATTSGTATNSPLGALGSAATNSSSAFDTNNAGIAAALAATNAMGQSSGLAAFQNTNFFDLAGAGTAAALLATNNFGNSIAVSLTNALNDYTGSNITASGQLNVSDTLNGTVNYSLTSIGSEFYLVDAQTYSLGVSLNPHAYASYAGLTANPTNNITGTASRKLIYTGVGAYYAVSYAPVAESTNSMYGDMYGSWFFAAAGNAMASTNSIGYGTYLTAYGFTTNYGVYVYQATGQAAPSNYFGTNISVGNYVGNGAGLTNLTSVIQQGSTNAVALTSFTATFSQPFVDTNYTAVATGNGFALASSYVSTKTVSSCVFNMTVATGNIDWMVVHQ